jgi:hypothetical protein
MTLNNYLNGGFKFDLINMHETLFFSWEIWMRAKIMADASFHWLDFETFNFGGHFYKLDY